VSEDTEVYSQKISVKERMEDSLQRGSSTALSATNKGFALLQKFGYKGTGGLGRDSSGIEAPIAVDMKVGSGKDRSGIGIAEEKKRKLDKFANDMKKICDMRDKMASDFRLRRSYEVEIKKIKRHVFAAEKVIYEYDTKAEVKTSSLWPSDTVNEEDSEGGNDDISDGLIIRPTNEQEDSEYLMDRLKLCLFYLRDTYSYCLFCGYQYENNDLEGCPGLLYEDH
jgi:Domain of unknown function (DUF4187)/G-patch domain